VVRPVFGAALEDLKRGRTPDGQWLDGLVVYDIDRLTRDNRHLEDCIEVVEHFGRPILDITGTLDLLTDNGRTVARIVVATYNKQHVQQAVSGYGAAGEAQAPSRPPPGPPASVRTSRSVQSGGPGGGPLPQGRVDGERGGSRIGS
jgi:DNA invertase Pin-like site-specific DNA recombinase